MTEQQAKYTRKLHQALTDIGHIVEKDPTTPDLQQIEDLFFDFIFAAKRGSMKEKRETVDKLLAGLVRWEVGKL